MFAREVLHHGFPLKIQLHDVGFADVAILGEVMLMPEASGPLKEVDAILDLVPLNSTSGGWRSSFGGVPVMDIQLKILTGPSAPGPSSMQALMVVGSDGIASEVPSAGDKVHGLIRCSSSEADATDADPVNSDVPRLEFGDAPGTTYAPASQVGLVHGRPFLQEIQGRIGDGQGHTYAPASEVGEVQGRPILQGGEVQGHTPPTETSEVQGRPFPQVGEVQGPPNSSSVQGRDAPAWSPPSRRIFPAVMEFAVDSRLWSRPEWKTANVPNSFRAGVPIPGMPQGRASMVGLAIGFDPATVDFPSVFPASKFINDDCVRRANILANGLSDIVQDLKDQCDNDAVIWGWWCASRWVTKVHGREVAWGPMAAYNCGMGGECRVEDGQAILHRGSERTNWLEHLTPYMELLHDILLRCQAKMEPWDMVAPIFVPAEAAVDKALKEKNLRLVEEAFPRRNLTFSQAWASPRSGTDLCIKNPAWIGRVPFIISSSVQDFMSAPGLGICGNRGESWWVSSNCLWYLCISVHFNRMKFWKLGLNLVDDKSLDEAWLDSRAPCMFEQLSPLAHGCFSCRLCFLGS